MSRTMLLLLLSGIVIVILVVIFYLLRGDAPAPRPVRDSGEEQPVEPPVPPPPAPGPSAPDRPDPAQQRMTREQAEQVDRAREFTLSKNRDFSYYGRIVDQLGEPVPGVSITAQLFFFHLAPSLSGQVRHLQLVSDAEGRFAITDQTARMLSFEFEKPGYQFEPSEGILLDEMDPTALTRLADAADPVVIHAWKKQPPDESVLIGDTGLRFEADGRYHGVPIAGFDNLIEVAFERDGTYRSPGDWLARLRVPGGAVQEDTGGFPYAAPESGYSAVWEVRHTTGDKGYALSGNHRFFISAPGHRVYASLQVDFRPFYSKDEKSAVFVDYRLNPTGTRNLLSPRD